MRGRGNISLGGVPAPRLFRTAGVALALLAGSCLQAAPTAGAETIPPFTIDSVLDSLRSIYPEVRRIPDELPPGVHGDEDLIYARRGETALQLDIYRPDGTALLPAAILVHGGGWVAGDRKMERAFAKNLAARGYVAVPVSYRLGVAGQFPAPIYDLKEAVRWLRVHAAQYNIDPRHIAAIGGSAGATLATMLGVTNGFKEFEGNGGSRTGTSDVQAVVNIDGTVTFMDNALIENSETQPSPYWEYLHGVYSQNRPTWLAASPIYYVTRQSAPTLFIKSTAVQPVLVGRSEMAARLRLLGVDSAEIQLPNTPHPFWLVHPWFEQVLADTDAFLRQHLR